MNRRIREAMRRVGKALRLLRRPACRGALLREGVAGSTEHDPVLRQGFDLVVDVGANRGQFSLAARHFNPKARIVAFEPLASAAAAYRRVFGRDALAVLHASAVGPSKGRAVMQLSMHEDSSSLLPIGELMPKLYPGTQASGTEDVAVAPLTEFLGLGDLAGRALLKIDVQGFELEVLKSAEPLLSDFTQIYVEASFVPLYGGQAFADEVVAFLQGRGFALAGFLNASFDPDTGLPVQADLLFDNKARVDRGR